MEEMIALGWQDANDGKYGMIPPPDLWERRPPAFKVYDAEELHHLITIHDPVDRMVSDNMRTIQEMQRQESLLAAEAYLLAACDAARDTTWSHADMGEMPTEKREALAEILSAIRLWVTAKKENEL